MVTYCKDQAEKEEVHSYLQGLHLGSANAYEIVVHELKQMVGEKS